MGLGDDEVLVAVDGLEGAAALVERGPVGGARSVMGDLEREVRDG